MAESRLLQQQCNRVDCVNERRKIENREGTEQKQNEIVRAEWNGKNAYWLFAYATHPFHFHVSDPNQFCLLTIWLHRVPMDEKSKWKNR